jgi:hypothetical protein
MTGQHTLRLSHCSAGRNASFATRRRRLLLAFPAGTLPRTRSTCAINRSKSVLPTLSISLKFTHTQALALLGRAECIIRDSPSTAPKQEKDDKHLLDLDMHYSIRALSSAYYNLGGMLYNFSCFGAVDGESRMMHSALPSSARA